MDAPMPSPADDFNIAGKDPQELGSELLRVLSAQQLDEPKALALINANTNIEMVNAQSDTPLITASFRGFTAIALALIAKKANVNARDMFGHSPVMLAATGGSEQIFDALLVKGSCLDTKNEFLQDAFFGAAEQGKDAILAKLILKGVKLEEPDHTGASPRMAALAKGHISTAKLIDAAIFARDLPLRQEQERKAEILRHIGDSFRDGLHVEQVAPLPAQFRKRPAFLP